LHINQLLQTAVASGASDLHLKVGSYPMMRVNGTLVVASEEKRLDRTDTEAIAQTILGPEHVEKFRRNQDVDLAYSIDGLGRFRCNVFQQRGTVGLVLRVIPTRIKSIRPSTSWDCRRSSRRFPPKSAGWCWSPAPRAAARAPRSPG
jgi:twitching motility protein PilT